MSTKELLKAANHTAQLGFALPQTKKSAEELISSMLKNSVLIMLTPSMADLLASLNLKILMQHLQKSPSMECQFIRALQRIK